MANPVFVDLPRNQWTLVATSVTSGQVSTVLNKPQQLLTAYRVTGDAAPTTVSDGIAMSDRSNIIRSKDPIDVYVYPQNENSKVRVDL